jgi:hypothetical protein
MKTASRRLLGTTLVAIGLLLLNAPGRAQEAPDASIGRTTPPQSPNSGVGLSNHNLSINGDSFTPTDSTFGWALTFVNGVHIKYATSGTPSYFHASFDLPSGAVLDAVALEIYDNSLSSDINFFVYRCDGSTALTSCTNIGQGNSSGASTTGYYIYTPSLNEVIDNLNRSYFIEVNAGNDHTGNLGWRRGNVYYHLQVSPAPGSSDFGDVPTSSPQFQFIEALFHAGITAGCGSGNFCPNQAVTRGQMAVFLSKALGLWFPN